MHEFSELVDRCVYFTLEELEKLQERVMEALQTSAATPLVKALQMIRLSKAILVVGMFSMFESILQDKLDCSNGFKDVKEFLKQKEEVELLDRFIELELAVNALKHGKGKSYNALIERLGGKIRSKVKKPDEYFFDEGDVSEVAVLVDVDDNFIHYCPQTIRDISEVIDKENSQYQ